MSIQVEMVTEALQLWLIKPSGYNVSCWISRLVSSAKKNDDVKDVMIWNRLKAASKLSQPGITCSKSTIETLEQGMKYVQS